MAMKDVNKTKEQLLHELAEMRLKITTYEKLETNLRKTKEKLEHQKKHLESLLKSSSLAIVELDEKQNITSCNRDFEKLFQYKKSEIVGKNLDEIIAGQEYLKDAVSYTRETLKGKTIHGYGERKRKDGATIDVEIFGVPVVVDGKLIGAYGIYQDISERKQAEELFRTLFNKSPVGLFIIKDRKFQLINPRFLELTGYKEDEFLGKDSLAFILPEDRDMVRENTIKMLKGKISLPFELRVINKKGETRWIEQTITSIQYNGRPAVLGYYVDISERKQAEEALRESEAKYSALVENSKDGIIIIHEGVLKFVNKASADIVGYSPKEMIGINFLNFAAPDYRELVLKRYADRLEGKEVPSIYEIELLRKDGKIVPAELNAIRIDFEGEPADLAVVRDISERKLVEQELTKSEERYRMLFKQSPLGIIHFDQKGVIVDCNEKFVEIMGSSRKKLIGFNMLKSLRDKKMLSAVKTALSGGTGYYEGDYLSVTGGKLTPMRAIYNRISSEDGSFLGGVSLYEDITERKRAEEELRDSEERLKTILDSIQAGIVCINAETHTIVDANPAAIEMIGAPKEQIIGHVCHKFICPAEKGKCPITDFGQEVDKSERTLLTANGKEIPILKTVTPILLSGQAHLLDIFIDMTEKKQLEAQLQQAQKMEAIGTLAGGIAHDFNNILQAISGYSQILLMGKKADNPDYEKLEAIEKSTQRASDLTKQLLIFSRKVESRLRPMDLNKETEQVSKMLERTIPKMITIELHLTENLNIVNADPAQIEQILMNISVNARDAMPHGGRLIFETENIILDENYCKIHLGSKPGNYVKLSISDTGHGMDKEILQHIFDPFYTTKETGKGTGLGLAMVYGIVKSHNGYIMCYSEPGVGTTFKIYFPVIKKETETLESRKEQFPIKGGNEAILLVDDEKAIRELGKVTLAKFGYTVLMASDGETALEIYRENQKEISLVILDMIMPGMGGKKCLEELLKIDPELRVIISSGYTMDGPSKEVLKAGAKGFIGKPYNINQILKAVREVLDN
jgi:two-component system cell cycle sensor histidine kinase/response regulator CckA